MKPAPVTAHDAVLTGPSEPWLRPEGMLIWNERLALSTSLPFKAIVTAVSSRVATDWLEATGATGTVASSLNVLLARLGSDSLAVTVTIFVSELTRGWIRIVIVAVAPFARVPSE